MRNTRIQNVRTQSPASMPSTRSHTLSGAMQSEDEDESCPSCDGHCTCRSQKRQQIILDHNFTSPIDQDTNEHSIGSPPPQPKKKRGRPPKAVVQARIAAAKAAKAVLGSSGSRSRPLRKVQAPASVQPRTSAPSQRKKLILTVKPKPTASRSKLKANAKKPVRRVVETSSDSDIDFLDDDDSDSVLGGEYPTFVSAESSSSSDDDSDSSLSSITDSADEEMRNEEEMLIMSEEQRKARVKRELLREDGGGRVPHKHWNHHQRESKRKRKSVSSDAGGSTDVITDSDEEENEDEDADAEDDPEPDQFRDEEFEFSSQSDDELDANLFFANLDDSSADEDSAIDADRSSAENGPEDYDLDEFAFRKAPQGALLVPFPNVEKGVGLLVTEDWNGQLVLGSGHRVGQGVLDMEFEMNAAKHKHHTHPRRGRSSQRGETESTDDEGAGSSDDETQAEGDDESLYMDSDAGNTTDDDFIDHQGPIRFPTPPSTAVDPMSTVSPYIAPRKPKATGSSSNSKPPEFGSLVRTPSSSRLSTSNGLPLESPKPSDILSGSARSSPLIPRGPRLGAFPITSPIFLPLTAATPPPSTPGSTTSYVSTPSAQVLDRAMTPTPISMGSLPTQTLIIDNNTIAIPSPFPKLKRIRRQRSGMMSSPGWSRERKRSADSGDISPYYSKRRRQSSVPGSVRSPLTHDEELSSSLELPPPAESIDIDDVLDSSFLDDDSESQATSSYSASTGTPADLFHSRWERVPMGTFRHSRAAGGVGGIVSQDEAGLSLQERSFKLGPRAAPDGFSYGSTAGAVLRKSPYPLPGFVSSLGAPFPLVGSLWNSGTETPNGKKIRDRPLSSMLAPVRPQDYFRERTPTQEFHIHPGNAGSPKGNMKSPNRRKKDRTAR